MTDGCRHLKRKEIRSRGLLLKPPAGASVILEDLVGDDNGGYIHATFKTEMTEVNQRPATKVKDMAVELERQLMLEKQRQ